MNLTSDDIQILLERIMILLMQEDSLIAYSNHLIIVSPITIRGYEG